MGIKHDWLNWFQSFNLVLWDADPLWLDTNLRHVPQAVLLYWDGLFMSGFFPQKSDLGAFCGSYE